MEYRGHRRRNAIAGVFCSAALLAPGGLWAQNTVPAEDAAAPVAATNGKQVYSPRDFARFAPTSALDMVKQIPGFSFQEADERRGLGQASSNVLINGKRISGKSSSVELTLGRINAKDVTRIEILDGSTSDIPGLSGRIANVVTSVEGLSGNFRWSPQIRAKRTDPRLLDGELSITGKSGDFDYTLSLSNTSYRNGNAGDEFVLDGNGQQIDQRYEELYIKEDRARLSGRLKYENAAGTIANLNLSYERFYNKVFEESLRTFPDIGRRDYRETEREWNYEVSGDYEFDLGAGRLKVIGLKRFEHSPFFYSPIFEYADGSSDTGDIFRRVADEGESILRSEYRWESGGADWQISAEGAYNTLDNRSELSKLEDGVFQPQPLPGGDAIVKEKRAELMLSYGRPLSESLTLQSAIGAEYSNIRQSGAHALDRTFYRPKGFVSLGWKVSPRLDLSAKIEREVGQLNFLDIVASVNLAGGNGNAGNPNLRPPQSWNLELEASRNLGAFGSIKAKLFAEFITDAVVQIPIGATGESPGNIDSARLFGLDWNSTINFDPFGWRGARLDLAMQFRNSRLSDPLTGEKRQLSEQMQTEIDANFRHDIPGSALAWGIHYNKYVQTAGFRLDQHSRFVNKPGDLGVFIEHKDVMGLTVRGGVSNLLGTNERFYRTIHAGRRTDPVLVYEDRSRYYGMVFDLSIRGSF